MVHLKTAVDDHGRNIGIAWHLLNVTKIIYVVHLLLQHSVKDTMRTGVTKRDALFDVTTQYIRSSLHYTDHDVVKALPGQWLQSLKIGILMSLKNPESRR
jgi:hypothetical protein